VFTSAWYNHYHSILDLTKNSEFPENRLYYEHLACRLDLDRYLLADALMRSFRRALYCKCFNGLELAQMKQAGLFAYWIAKIRPVKISIQPAGLPDLSFSQEKSIQETNERFAFSIVRSFYKLEFGRELPNPTEYQEHFVHALWYRSFTEDSMMMVTESLWTSRSS
jgi:hypothetical protein